MKRLKEKQLGPFCTYCPPKTIKAVYREDNWAGKFSCVEHKQLLMDAEERARAFGISEADRQTWMRERHEY